MMSFAQGGKSGKGGGGNGGGGNGGGGNGGGGGDTFVTYFTFLPQSCPIPLETRNDYVNIAFCGLGKMSRDINNWVILVDGYTNLAPGTSKTVIANVPLTLPCGNIVTFTRYDEAAFAQSSPPPPPYRLTTLSTKVADTCPH